MCGFCIVKKGWAGGGGWGQPQSAVHMVAARLGCDRAMFGTWWATSRPDCMDRLRKHYSHFVEGWFLARKDAWVLSTWVYDNHSVDYCMIVNERAWSKSRVCLGWKWIWVQFWSQSLDRNRDMVH